MSSHSESHCFLAASISIFLTQTHAYTRTHAHTHTPILICLLGATTWRNKCFCQGCCRERPSLMVISYGLSLQRETLNPNMTHTDTINYIKHSHRYIKYIPKHTTNCKKSCTNGCKVFTGNKTSKADVV